MGRPTRRAGGSLDPKTAVDRARNANARHAAGGGATLRMARGCGGRCRCGRRVSRRAGSGQVGADGRGQVGRARDGRRRAYRHVGTRPGDDLGRVNRGSIRGHSPFLCDDSAGGGRAGRGGARRGVAPRRCDLRLGRRRRARRRARSGHSAPGSARGPFHVSRHGRVEVGVAHGACARSSHRSR